MLLMNTSDSPMAWSAGVRPPDINGPEERCYPPRMFQFAPGEMLEVPDDAGLVLLDHLGGRGLMRLTLYTNPKEMATHVAEVRAAGRRQWLVWLESQVRRHRRLNEEQRQKGLSSIDPNADVLTAYRMWKKLKATEFSDEILADSQVQALSAEERSELNGDETLTRNAQREAARAADVA